MTLSTNSNSESVMSGPDVQSVEAGVTFQGVAGMNRTGQPVSVVVEESVEEADAVRAELDKIYLARLQAEQKYGVSLGGGFHGVDEDSEPESVSPTVSDDVERERRRALDAVMANLQTCAERVARISKRQFVSRYRRGRPTIAQMKLTPEIRQKYFKLEGTTVVQELEEAGGLYRRILEGEVVLEQIIARTGIGKTRVFSSRIARKCGARVLLLQNDMDLVDQAAEAAREVVPVRTRWTRQRVAHMTVMTYSDFDGMFETVSGEMMLQQFDVVVMDEAHTPYAAVAAAKYLFATFTPGNVSLLILSATLEGQDMQSGVGAAEPKRVSGTILSNLKQGKIVRGEHLRDRTMLIVPNDEIAAECQSLIDEEGHICYMLDSASTPADRRTVQELLRKNSTTPRFLVTTEKYGTGSNFTLAAVMTDAAREVSSIDDDTREIKVEIVPVTESEEKQHLGRVKRGFAKGNATYVFQGYGKAVPDKEVLDSERFELFLRMRASGVKVLKSLEPSPGFIPFGITPQVARDVLAINLPPLLAIRYFASDGALPSRFARALLPFSSVQRHFVASREKNPIGFDGWKSLGVGGFFGSSVDNTVRLNVPYDVENSTLRVKMFAISAIAEGFFGIEDWTPQITDSEGSGDESVVAAPTGERGRLPRLVMDTRTVTPPPVRRLPWAFNARLEDQVNVRDGVLFQPGNSHLDATLDYLRSIDSEKVVESPTSPVSEVHRNGKLRVQIHSERPLEVYERHVTESPIEITSPRGSVVVTIRKDVWQRLTAGANLSADEMCSMVRAVKSNISGFVKSSAFDNWSNVWISIIKSCASGSVLAELQQRNLINAASALLQAMYVRYVAAVDNVVEVSHVKSKFWKRVVVGRSFEDQLQDAKRKGKVEVAQSERFFRRVYEIRSRIAEAVVIMEEYGIFTPGFVAQAQARIPMVQPKGTGVRLIDKVSQGPRFERRRIGGGDERSS